MPVRLLAVQCGCASRSRFVLAESRISNPESRPSRRDGHHPVARGGADPRRVSRLQRALLRHHPTRQAALRATRLEVRARRRARAHRSLRRLPAGNPRPARTAARGARALAPDLGVDARRVRSADRADARSRAAQDLLQFAVAALLPYLAASPPTSNSSPSTSEPTAGIEDAADLHRYAAADGLAAVCERILADYPFANGYADIAGCVKAIARTLGQRMRARGGDRAAHDRADQDRVLPRTPRLSGRARRRPRSGDHAAGHRPGQQPRTACAPMR